MGTDARGLGSGVSLRKVLDLPSSPAHTGLSLEQGSGILGTCAIPLHSLPDGPYPSSITHSFLLKLEVSIRILLTPPLQAATPPWFGRTQDKTFSSSVAEYSGCEQGLRGQADVFLMSHLPLLVGSP